MTRLSHVWLAVATLPFLVVSRRGRALLAEMQSFCRSLPEALQGPLLEALRWLTPAASTGARPAAEEATVRKLSDLAVLLDRRSPLGFCLRRSLTRFHYLRAIGVPVVLQFGAKLAGGKPDRAINGHAWLTLHGEPYYEAAENYRGFAVMFTFPAEGS